MCREIFQTPACIPWVEIQTKGILGNTRDLQLVHLDRVHQPQVIVCWTNRQWQLQEACHTEDASPLIPIFVVTLSIMRLGERCIKHIKKTGCI